MSENTETETENKTNNWKDTHPEVGALWIKAGREQKYMSGYVETAEGTRSRVIVYSNKYKNNENAPDFRVYLSNTDNAPSEQSVDAFDALEAPSSSEGVSSAEEDESLL